MGWSDYLAAAGCLGTAASYQLYQSKITEYENLELQLEHEYQQANSTFNNELDGSKAIYSSGILNSEPDEVYVLKNALSKIGETNQVLKSEATHMKEENVELEDSLKTFQGKIDNLESDLQKAGLEKISLKELYQFKLNNEIEKLITSRDLEIANLHDTVKDLNKEKKKVNEIDSKLSEVNKKQILEIDEKVKQIDLLNKQKACDEQSLEGLSKKLNEFEMLNVRHKEYLDNKGKELDRNRKEIVELNQELNKNKGELPKLLSQIEYSQKNITNKEKLFSIGNQEINELREEIANQSRLLESKKVSLNATLETQDAFMTKYRELGCEIAQLFVEVAEIEKNSDGEDSRSEEFEIVKYNENKRSSEDFEEVNIEDANKTSSESSDKEHEHDKEYGQVHAHEGMSEKAEGSEYLQDKDDDVKATEPSTDESFRYNLRKIQRVREYIKNSKSAINDQLFLRQDKRSLVQKLNKIIDEYYEAKTASFPDATQKLESETGNIEHLDTLGSPVSSPVSELQLEHNLKSMVHEASEKENQIKALESKLANLTVKFQDVDHLKQVNKHLDEALHDYTKTLTARENKIDYLSDELSKLPNATKEITNLNAELSVKDKQIYTLESHIQELLHANKLPDNGRSKCPRRMSKPMPVSPKQPQTMTT